MRTEIDPTLLIGLRALEPYLADIVIVGGWAPYLYALHQGAVRSSPPRTADIDIAVPRALPPRGPSIDELLSRAGFECEFRSRDVPPVTAYVARRGDDDVEIEFITDSLGADEQVVEVQDGLTAQELHYVRLLLENTWTIDLAKFFHGDAGQEVRVPTPAAFMLHKGLVYRKRSDQLKKEKDLYYVFYVVDTFVEWHDWIRSDLSTLAARWPAWLKRCAANLGGAFAASDSAGVQALLNQRPQTAYSGLNDDQFREYAWSTMKALEEMMRTAPQSSGR
ncbi:MAG: nucleotidyltransferase domain-containing protein [Thermoleophilia bacterium]|nr:nucleotidyltransferase domain-containing protein [Thermoleophilia bacterium]